MNRLHTLMMRKVRGVRVVDIAAAACLLLIVLTVYWSKAGAGAEAAKIADTTRQITAETQRLRLLQAEHAYLTQPERLRRLSAQFLNMGPVKGAHEVAPEALAYVRRPVETTPVAAPAQGVAR